LLINDYGYVDDDDYFEYDDSNSNFRNDEDSGYQNDDYDIRHDESKSSSAGSTGLCKTLLAPKNGEIALTTEGGNPTAKYKCVKGKLEGDKIRMCTKKGKWSGKDPKCSKFGGTVIQTSSHCIYITHN